MKNHFVVMAGIAGIFTACSDFDFEQHHIKEDPVKKAEYAANWNSTFGMIDPNQDWNSVMQVTAYVDFSEYEDLKGCTLKVYTGDPYAKGTQLLAKYDITSPKMIVTFDALKAIRYVYIVREKADGFYAAQVADVKNGTCSASFDTSNISMTRASSTRAIDTWDGTVPVNPATYPTEVPADAFDAGGMTYLDENNVNGKKVIYLHDVDHCQINFWIGGQTIYFGGNVTIDNGFACRNNSKFYLLPGATLTFNQEVQFRQNELTISPGAKLILPNGFKVETSTAVYNGGNVEASWADIETELPVYNEGNIKLTGDVSISSAWQKPTNIYNTGSIQAANIYAKEESLFFSSGSLIASGAFALTNGHTTFVNRGDLTAASLATQGSSSFYNQGTGVVNVSGLTRVDSNCSAWQNLGHYTTGSMLLNSTSARWHNGCYLKVLNEFKVETADSAPAMTNDSYIECGTYYQNDSRLELAADAQLTVNGTATFQYNCYLHKGDGLISTATGDNWAVFKAAKILFTNPQMHGSVSYVGNLIVDCNDYPKRDTDSGLDSGYNWSLFEGAKLATSGDGYTIPADECREPYSPRIPEIVPEVPAGYIIACEDLGTTNDIDFNDVVILVSHVAGEKTATVTPLAAGGTLRSNVIFRGQNLGEIHYLIDGSNGESGSMMMLNTSYAAGANPGRGEAITIEVEPDFTLSYDQANMGGFSIVTYQKNSGSPISSVMIKAPEQGDAPQMILVPGDWQWPTERVQIESAYPDFLNWSQMAGRSTEWYKQPARNASVMSL